MSELNLEALAQFAVANNNSAPSRTPTYELGIEDARAKVVVKDGNKKPAEDGSQALTLQFGKVKLPLDVVSANATRINAPKEQVEAFTEILLTAVKEGRFDEVIIAAQKAMKERREKQEQADKQSTDGSKPAQEAEEAAPEAQTDPAADTGIYIPEAPAKTEAPAGLDGLDLDSLNLN